MYTQATYGQLCRGSYQTLSEKIGDEDETMLESSGSASSEEFKRASNEGLERLSANTRARTPREQLRVIYKVHGYCTIID